MQIATFPVRYRWRRPTDDGSIMSLITADECKAEGKWRNLDGKIKEIGGKKSVNGSEASEAGARRNELKYPEVMLTSSPQCFR